MNPNLGSTDDRTIFKDLMIAHILWFPNINNQCVLTRRFAFRYYRNLLISQPQWCYESLKILGTTSSKKIWFQNGCTSKIGFLRKECFKLLDCRARFFRQVYGIAIVSFSTTRNQLRFQLSNNSQVSMESHYGLKNLQGSF